MVFLNGKNVSLSDSILKKVYFANLITTIAILCIIAFGIHVKFSNIVDNMYSNNDDLKNLILARAKSINSELALLGVYVESSDSDTNLILSQFLKNSQDYHAVYFLNSNGDIQSFATMDGEIDKRYMDFFRLRYWENKFVNGIYRSEFYFGYGEIPTRFVVKELDNGNVLVVELKLHYIYDEIMRTYSKSGANSFYIDDNGKIFFHQDINLVLSQKSIFDLYNVDENYMSENNIKISSMGSNKLDLYLIRYAPEIRSAIVTYYPISVILASNWLFLLICALFLAIALYFVFVDIKFTKTGILRPLLIIKRVVKKIEKEESVNQYLGNKYVSDFNDIIKTLADIGERYIDKKNELIECKRKFGYLFEQGPLIILLIDAKTGEIIEASEKALEFYGFKKDELVGQSLRDLDATSNLGANILTCNYADGTISYEAAQRMSNGEIKDVIINKKNIEVGEDKFGFYIIRDITWEKLNKRNVSKENETHVYSPVLEITWRDKFLQGVSSVSVNVERMTGYRVEELLDQNFNFKNIIHPDDCDRVLNEFNIKFMLFGTTLAKKEYEFLQTCRIVKKNLETVTCTIFVKFVSRDNKNIDEVIGYFINSAVAPIPQDDGVRKESLVADKTKDEDLEFKSDADRYKKIISHIFMHSKEAMAILDAEAKFLEINEVFTKITGYEEDEVVGKTANMLNSGVHDSRFFASLWQKIIKDGYWKGHIWNKRKNGEKYLEFLNIATIYGVGGDIEGFVAIFSDISNIEAKERNLKQIAYYDSLTRLPNRFLFAKKLAEAVKDADRLHKLIAVIYIDMDDFKSINDLHGHAIGDKFLIEASKNIGEVLKENDTLARVGGDEFVAIVNDITDKRQVYEIVEDMLRAANKRLAINGKKLKTSVSIGVSIYPQKSKINRDLLVEQADWAMYQSKLAGKNKYYIFDPKTDSHFKDNYSISDRISAGLTNNEFSLLYQPIYNVKTNTIVGLESFVARSDGSAVPHEEILPAATKGYAHEDLVLWNMAIALKDQRTLREKYGLNLKVGVGVTLELIYRADFISKFKSLIENERYENLHMLEFNIKESNMFKQTEDAEKNLNIYKDNGISLTLDQFGSDSTSLQILKDIQVDKLTISERLSMGVVRQVDSLIILKTALTLSNTFSKETTVKGVETSKGMYLLVKIGYENLQGGFIAPAMKIGSIKRWLDSYKAPDNLKNIEPLKENELIRCNLAVMHRGWIRSLLYMLSASNLSRFNTDEFAKEYSSIMINSYKKYISDDKKMSIHVEISDIIMNILTNIEKKESISKLVSLLKEKRDKILNLE